MAPCFFYACFTSSLGARKDLAKVKERFDAVAAAYAVEPDEALREALPFWLRTVPASSDFALEDTGDQFRLEDLHAAAAEGHETPDAVRRDLPSLAV